MPSARAVEFRRAALRLGFERRRQTGSHERWIHQDGRAVTIPIHGGSKIGPPLFHKMLAQLGVSCRRIPRAAMTSASSAIYVGTTFWKLSFPMRKPTHRRH